MRRQEKHLFHKKPRVKKICQKSYGTSAVPGLMRKTSKSRKLKLIKLFRGWIYSFELMSVWLQSLLKILSKESSYSKSLLVNSTKHVGSLFWPSLNSSKKWRAKRFPHSFYKIEITHTKTRQKYYNKRELQANIPD